MKRAGEQETVLAFEGNASQGRSTSENRFSKRPLRGNDPRWKVGLSPAAASRYHSITSILRRQACRDIIHRERNSRAILSNDLQIKAK